MKFHKITDFINGWFIGDFEPSLLRTANFEIAHHHYKKGVISTPHTHLVASEYNYIVCGKVYLPTEDRYLESGDMFIYEPKEVSNVEFLEDTDLIIIKVPSLPTDKYPV